MGDWITWAIQGAIGILVGAITWRWQRDKTRMEAKHDKETESLSRRVKELEDSYRDLPFVYTTREDFIRSTTAIDRKLDKIYDCISKMSKEDA